MKNLHIFAFLNLFLGFVHINSLAQTQNWQWAKSAGGGCGNSIATDANGNSYVTGIFSSPTITFGSINLSNTTTDTTDIFVVKYNAYGTVLWAKSAGGADVDNSNSISVDVNGNIIITGWFKSSTITFDTIILSNDTTSSTSDIFIVKYDTSGNVLWAKSAGGIYDDVSISITTDATGNSFITGRFNSPTLIFGGTTLNNTSGSSTTVDDIFVVKYDVSGNVLWAKSATGAGGVTYDGGQGICSDGNNVYVTGFFSGPSITFDTITITSIVPSDIFVAKYDASGNAIWAKSAGGTSSDIARDISIDASGNCYVVGHFFSPTIIFGNDTLANNGGSDLFLVKYDVSGNILWAKSAGGSGYEQFSDISTDSNGNSYVTGSYGSPTIIFGNDTLANNGGSDLFLAKYDVSGNVLWVFGAGGTSGDAGYGINRDANSNSYITGSFGSPTLTFGNYTLTNMGTGDLFVAKLGLCNLSQPEILVNGATSLCQGDSVILFSSSANSYLWNNGDTIQTITVNSNGNYFLTITDSSGCTAISDTTIITFHPLPTAIITSVGNCQGDSITLSASSSNTYLWSNGATTQNIAITSSGNYSVIVIDTNGCSATSSVKKVFVTICDSAQLTIYDTIPVYDTTFVTVNDTVSIYDTTFVMVYDTVPVYDTTFITVNDTVAVYDTTFVTVTDTNFITVNDTDYITVYDSIAVTDTLIIDVNTGLNPPNNVNTIKIYPNPAMTHITIDNGNYSLLSGYSIKITNTLSQIVFQDVINQQQFYIDITTWTGNGTYFVNIYDPLNNLIDVRKIILQ